MVTSESVEKQLKKLHVNQYGWGRTELRELPHILLPDEEMYECVNGIYEGGFALLVSTNIRVLLIDKKPLNYLTVEDLRFDMINEIDYSHRLIGAQISISAGSKNLKFRSYNQPRLRKLISHVQHCMAEIKQKQSEHQEDQSQHLERINQQLQSYLLAQHKQQQELQEKLEQADKDKIKDIELPQPVKPSPELADYLFAQSLLAQHAPQAAAQTQAQPADAPQAAQEAKPAPAQPPASDDLYQAGMQEIFGKHAQTSADAKPATPAERAPNPAGADSKSAANSRPLEVNPMRIAYSKLPMAMRNRKFGRPSIHAHNDAMRQTQQATT